MHHHPLRNACHFAIGLAIAALILHTWFVMGLFVPVVVSGSSMSPTLGGNDGRARVFVDRTAFALRAPRRWDVIVFRHPYDTDQLCVKRIVGLPRETVTLENGDVLIDGQRVQVPIDKNASPRRNLPRYLVRPGDRPELVDGRTAADVPWPDLAGPGRAATWQLGPGEYFVMGDNADISDDSRSWVSKAGLDAKLLIGKPLGVR